MSSYFLIVYNIMLTSFFCSFMLSCATVSGFEEKDTYYEKKPRNWTMEVKSSLHKDLPWLSDYKPSLEKVLLHGLKDNSDFVTKIDSIMKNTTGEVQLFFYDYTRKRSSSYYDYWPIIFLAPPIVKITFSCNVRILSENALLYYASFTFEDKPIFLNPPKPHVVTTFFDPKGPFAYFDHQRQRRYVRDLATLILLNVNKIVFLDSEGYL